MIPVFAIVGYPNVGKSTLFNCLTKSQRALVANIPGLTRDRQYGEGHFESHPFIVIDTGGLEGSASDLTDLITQQALQAVQEADAILFVVDARAGRTAADQRIAEQLRQSGKPIHLIVNKIDDQTLVVHLIYRL